MNSVWLIIAVLFVATVALKVAGPVTLGERRPPDRALAVIGLVAPAVLTALVVYQTFSETPSGIAVDERVVGVLAAAGALAARLPMIVVVLLAAVTTALARLLFE
jgi:uncharacterized membrane protein